MRTITRKKNGVYITDRTPACRDWHAKFWKHYRDLKTFIENDPKLKLLAVKRYKEK